MKELKDYLHLYYGCDMIDVQGNKGILVGIDETSLMVRSYVDNMLDEYAIRLLKPILRPLSDMTHEERVWMFVLRATANGDTVDKECARTGLERTFMQIEFCDRTSDYQDIKTLYPEQTKFLLSKGFDLFNLIEENLAIDKTKLK